MFKRLLAVATFAALTFGMVGAAPADCTNCPCPPPPPPPPPPCDPCGVQGVLLQTDICLDDCACPTNCHTIKVRFLEECSPTARVIDQVCAEWCDCFCEPVVGANEVLTVEQVDIVDNLATVVFRVEANPLFFPNGFFGDVVRGFEVSIDGKCVIGCAALTCDLAVGSEFSVDWDLWGRAWFGGAAKISTKASAKASAKVSSSGKVSAKASAKASVKISGKGWKIYAKASAKSSVKVGKSGVSAKSSAKASIKIKGAVPFAVSPFALAVAQAGVGVVPFSVAFANAWAAAITPVGPRAVGVAGAGGAGAVAVAGIGPWWSFTGCSAGRFFVLDILGNCEDCCCQDCPCTGPECEPPPGPCAECDGRVTKLTMRYTGATAATIVVSGGSKKSTGDFFSGTVQPGATFTFSGTPTMGTNIYFSVNGTIVTRIHTSCSQPIGPQMAPFGDFVVVAGESSDGGPMCPLPGATQRNHGIP